MRRLFALTVLGTTAGLVVGCAPSPSRLCKHKMELVGERWTPESWRAGMNHCKAEAEALERTNPKLYACRAECVMNSKHLTDAADCDRNCR